MASRKIFLALKLLVGGVLGLLLISFAFLIIANIQSKNNLKGILARQKKEGFIMTPERLIIHCPESGNAAILIRQITQKFRFSIKAEEVAWRWFEEGKSITDSEKDTIRNAINDNMFLDSLLKEAAAHPYYVPLIDYSQPINKWYDENIQKFSAPYLLLIKVRAFIALEDHDTSMAQALCLTGLRIVDKMMFGYGSFLDYIIRYDLVMTSCEDIFSGSDASEEICRQVVHALNPDNIKKGFVDYMNWSRMASLADGQDFLKGDMSLLSSLPYYSQGDLWKIYFHLKPLLRNDIARTQEYYVELVKAAGKPYLEAEPVFESITNNAKISFPWHDYLYLNLNEEIFYLNYVTVYIARMEVTRLAFACKAYAARNGDFPSDLNLLAPEFLEVVPLDPFTGGVFRYRKFPEGGFVIYSAGINRRDDGADWKFDDFLDMLQKNPECSDDIIWLELPPGTKMHLKIKENLHTGGII